MKDIVCILAGCALAACSREPVATPTDAASKASAQADGTAPADWRDYVNHRFDFAVEVPPGFVAEPPPANGDGRLFMRGAARLRVSAGHNLEDAFEDQIAAAKEGLSLNAQARTSDATWRARGREADGRRVLLVLARGEERLVTVRFGYPPQEDLAAHGERVVDSLQFVGHVGPFTYRYRPDRFTLQRATLTLPGAHGEPIEAEKLIARSRAARQRCRYGLSGRQQACDVDREAGLAFAVLDRPLDALRRTVPAALTEPSRLAGRSGFRAVEQADGSGASYAFIPVGAKTVAVVHRWRPGEDAAGVDAVLRSLSTAGAAAVSPASGPAMAWNFSTAAEPKLAYGAPQTDQARLILQCEGSERVALSFLRPSAAGLGGRLIVSAGGTSQTAPVQARRTRLGGISVRAEMPAAAAPLQRFRGGSTLRVDWHEDAISVPPAGPAANRFFAACRRRA